MVCVDDEWGRPLAAEATIPVRHDGAWPTTPTGAGPTTSTRGRAGGRTHLVDPGRGRATSCVARLIGAVNLTNAALAYVTLVAAGIDPVQAREGIAALTSIPGRMEPIDVGQPFAVIVDYAHTPEAVTTLLADARRLATTAAG